MTCPVCGTVTIPGARFCHNCGTQLLAIASPVAERRIVNLSEYPVSDDAVALQYGGSRDSQALIDRLMAGEAPTLALKNDEGEVLAASRVAIEDKASLARGLQSAFSRCIVMIERAIEQHRAYVAGGNEMADPASIVRLYERS